MKTVLTVALAFNGVQRELFMNREKIMLFVRRILMKPRKSLHLDTDAANARQECRAKLEFQDEALIYLAESIIQIAADTKK